MRMLTHRICMALRGLGRLKTVDRVMRLRAEMLLPGRHGDRSAPPAGWGPGTAGTRRTHVLSWKRTKFLTL